MIQKSLSTGLIGLVLILLSGCGSELSDFECTPEYFSKLESLFNKHVGRESTGRFLGKQWYERVRKFNKRIVSKCSDHTLLNAIPTKRYRKVRFKKMGTRLDRTWKIEGPNLEFGVFAQKRIKTKVVGTEWIATAGGLRRQAKLKTEEDYEVTILVNRVIHTLRLFQRYAVPRPKSEKKTETKTRSGQADFKMGPKL